MTDNTERCDKCKKWKEKDKLRFVSADNFKPKEGEVVPVVISIRYDKLCEDCYQLELKLAELFKK